MKEATLKSDTVTSPVESLQQTVTYLKATLKEVQLKVFSKQLPIY